MDDTRIKPKKDIFQKMQILSDSAKYDVSCSSSGSELLTDKRKNLLISPIKLMILLHNCPDLSKR